MQTHAVCACCSCLAPLLQLGADMVSVTVSKSSDSCGVAYLGPNSPALFYSSIQIPCFNQFTFAHELG